PVATLRVVAPEERRTFGVRPDLKVPDEFFFAPLPEGRVEGQPGPLSTLPTPTMTFSGPG
ncbi:hypothetical protein, partial [Actinomyces succiniciruminis]|uniref:hypothetical protein n=1 Tax=Actinomyces succiniciruminis TaxID=1522002 RepID=UPI001B338F7F